MLNTDVTVMVSPVIRTKTTNLHYTQRCKQQGHQVKHHDRTHGAEEDKILVGKPKGNVSLRGLCTVELVINNSLHLSTNFFTEHNLLNKSF